MTGAIAGWFRFADGREPDPLALLTVCDVLPPVTFDLGMPGWAPTLELTVHVRAHPAPGWLKVRHATRNLAGGMFEEDCEIWDSAGRLVAQSRQLALLPRPMCPASSAASPWRRSLALAAVAARSLAQSRPDDRSARCASETGSLRSLRSHCAVIS